MHCAAACIVCCSCLLCVVQNEKKRREEAECITVFSFVCLSTRLPIDYNANIKISICSFVWFSFRSDFDTNGRTFSVCCICTREARVFRGESDRAQLNLLCSIKWDYRRVCFFLFFLCAIIFLHIRRRFYAVIQHSSAWQSWYTLCCFWSACVCLDREKKQNIFYFVHMELSQFV